MSRHLWFLQWQFNYVLPILFMCDFRLELARRRIQKTSFFWRLSWLSEATDIKVPVGTLCVLFPYPSFGSRCGPFDQHCFQIPQNVCRNCGFQLGFATVGLASEWFFLTPCPSQVTWVWTSRGNSLLFVYPTAPLPRSCFGIHLPTHTSCWWSFWTSNVSLMILSSSYFPK